MSEHEPEGLYIYQPHGMQDKAHWESQRIYAIGGLPLTTRIDGLTKPEAESLLKALNEFRSEPK